MVEVRAVVDGGDGGRGAAEDFGLPCVLGLVLVGNWEPVKGGGGRTGVEVAVEVDHGDRTVGTVDGAQEREGDGVVAAEGDDAG